MGRTLIIAGVALLALVAAYYFWGRPAAKVAMPAKDVVQDLIDRGAPRPLVNEVARREALRRRIERINRHGWR